MGANARNELIRILESIEIKGKVNRKRIKIFNCHVLDIPRDDRISVFFVAIL